MVRSRRGPTVAVVTDSTASLPPGAAERWGILVVPLDVVTDGVRHVEGVDLEPSELLGALARGERVSTSQPPPAAFERAYREALASGATEIVSIHLSEALSGTVQAARVAAAALPVAVHVVDSRAVGMALGFAVLEAARYAGAEVAAPEAGPADAAESYRDRVGAWWARRSVPPPTWPTGAQVAAVAARAAAGARVWFLVDSVDHLRRGGRLSATAAAIGTVLGLRPILTLQDGSVVVAEKVRTRRAARERLEAIALAAVAERGTARIAVHHLGQADVADAVAEDLRERAGGAVVDAVVCESSAVIAAHVGPGLLAVVVADA